MQSRGLKILLLISINYKNVNAIVDDNIESRFISKIYADARDSLNATTVYSHYCILNCYMKLYVTFHLKKECLLSVENVRKVGEKLFQVHCELSLSKIRKNRQKFWKLVKKSVFMFTIQKWFENRNCINSCDVFLLVIVTFFYS